MYIKNAPFKKINWNFPWQAESKLRQCIRLYQKIYYQGVLFFLDRKPIAVEIYPSRANGFMVHYRSDIYFAWDLMEALDYAEHLIFNYAAKDIRNMGVSLSANGYSDEEAIKLVSIVAKTKISFFSKIEFKNWLHELKCSKFE